MIKHSLKDNVIFIAIANVDFSYRIPIKKIENTIDWRIGKTKIEGIVIKEVSTWALQLFTNKVTESKYIKQFKSIVQEYAPSNSINWEDTLLAINIQNEYNWLQDTNKTAKKKHTEVEIISRLKKKYNID